MRRIAIAVTCVLMGCAGEAPTAVYDLEPTAALNAKRALPKNYTAQLSGAKEVPARETLSRGAAKFQVSQDGQSISYQLNVANLNNLTMAHIHMGPAEGTGPIIVWLYPEAPPASLIPGNTSGVLATGTITAANLTGLLAGKTIEDLLVEMNADRTYVNVHTTLYPAGEIRGQIKPGG